MTDPRHVVRRAFARLFQDRRGATAIEYGLICALIVVAVIGALAAVANTTTGMWNNVSDEVTRAIGGA